MQGPLGLAVAGREPKGLILLSCKEIQGQARQGGDPGVLVLQECQACGPVWQAANLQRSRSKKLWRKAELRNTCSCIDSTLNPFAREVLVDQFLVGALVKSSWQYLRLKLG